LVPSNESGKIPVTRDTPPQYTLYSNPSEWQKYWCATPADNCTRISFQPTKKMETIDDVNIRDFIIAVDKHQVSSFFKTDKWKTFLSLSTSNLEELKNGKLVVRAYEQAGKNTTVYIGVPAGTDTNKKSVVGDARFAVEISN
jgi:hypothetical protein